MIPLLAQRVISVVPSITELLVDLGLGDRLIGSTLFCIHPPSLKKSTTRIGGTKTLKLDKIRNLKPDLIIANKEENVKEQIEELSKDIPVWTSDVGNLEDSLQMIKALGDILQLEEKANLLSEKIAASFQELATKNEKSCIYLIWRDPYMSVGKDTFIHDMINLAGFKNVLSNRERYPEISKNELQALNPDIIMLSSEPYPFREKHIKEMQAILPASQVVIVDGELFSWYGSRLLKSVNYFRSLNF